MSNEPGLDQLVDVLAEQRAVLAQLTQALRDAPGSRSGLAVLDGPQELGAVLTELARDCRREQISISRRVPSAPVAELGRALDAESVRRGVRLRAVLAADLRGTAFAAELAGWGAGTVRVSATDVRPLLVADRSVALVGRSRGAGADPGVGGPVLVREPALVDVLQELAELVWRTSPPLVPDRASGGDALALRPRQLAVLANLCAGQTDVAIARSLGVSERTVRSDVAGVLVALGAGSRAEACFLAGARGLLPVPPAR